MIYFGRKIISMGGTKADFIKNKLINKLSEDLDLVKFHIDFSGNMTLIQVDPIYDSISKTIQNYLKKTGVKYLEVGVGGGGGGLETLKEIVEGFLANRDILVSASSLIYFIKNLYTSHLNLNLANSKPNVNLNFIIDSDLDTKILRNKELEEMVSNRLKNLLQTARAICLKIENRY